MVLVKDPDAAVFEPRYQPNFRVTAIFGNNSIEVQEKRGHKSIRRSAHGKYITPSEKVVKQLPSEQVLKNYGRSLKLLLTEKDIPDLHFDVAETKEKGKPSERADVMEIMNVDTKESAQNSDSREHSRNLLKSVAGRALHQRSEHRNVEKTIGTKLLKETSEYRELSQKSRNSEHLEETSRKMVKRTLSRDTQPEHSESRELSPNSRVVTECSEGTQKKHHTRPVCIGEPSKYSRDSLGGVGSNVSVPHFSWFKSMSQIVGLTATSQDNVEGNPMGAGTANNAKINTNPVHTGFNFFL